MSPPPNAPGIPGQKLPPAAPEGPPRPEKRKPAITQRRLPPPPPDAPEGDQEPDDPIGARLLSEPPLPVDVTFDVEPDTGVKSTDALIRREGELVEETAALKAELAGYRRKEHAAKMAEETQDRRALADFPDTVRIQYGGLRVTVPLVLFAGLLGGGGVWYATHAAAPPRPAEQCLTREQFEESMRTRDERLSRRLDTIETDTSYLKVAVRLVQDRLPPAK